jgi:membrane protease YdiL (CAAX protease family)
LRDALPLALAGGVVSAAVLVVHGLGTAGYFVEQSADLELPMVTRVGYGGVAEEILMRWGLMSLLALAALKLGLRRPGALWAGNLAAALIFAVGHLPALYALVDPPAGLVAAVVLGNTSVGLIFGWAFARRGLEAAMIAHACAHLFAIPVLTMLG